MLRDLLDQPDNGQKPKKAASQPSSRVGSKSILGANTHFIGTLKAGGDVVVQDIFEGDISARGDVTIGKQATLDGDLACHAVVISGLMRGDITAASIRVTGTGRVLGNMRTEKLLTEEGAFIQGVITLEDTLPPEEITLRKPAADTEEVIDAA